MKVTYLNRNSIWNYFSDFANPSFFSNPLSLKHHQYKTHFNRKFIFVQKLINENKFKNLYRRLGSLYRNSLDCFQNHIVNGQIDSDLHPIDEQSWFIRHLKTKVDDFSTHELWHIILNHEQREKYVKYLDEDVDAFELFLQNYLLQALSGRHLKEIFFIAFEGNAPDQSVHLKKLFQCLHCKQGKLLFETLKKEKASPKIWAQYCKNSISVMRNSQIKEIISLIPSEIEYFALEKLYPCEILEVVDQELDEKKKRYLVDKILKSYKNWWRFFSQDEINSTYLRLLEKIS